MFREHKRAKAIGPLQLKWFNRWWIYVLYFLVPILFSYSYKSVEPVDLFLNVTMQSMSPTIENTEYVAYNKRYTDPLPGDVLAYNSRLDTGRVRVSRCVAIAGQTVEIRRSILYINGQIGLPSLQIKRAKPFPLELYDDNRIWPNGKGNEDNFGPIIIPSGHVFMLGDYRDLSFDSRYFGPLPIKEIRGKILYISLSPSISRIGSIVM
jgi:signal peptidase I